MVAVAARNTDGYVRVKSRGFNKLDVIDLATAEPQAGESTHSASLIRGIAEGFRAVGKQIGGFDAYTASDVLRGSGLSSSAAFEMGMASIWNEEYSTGLTLAELAGICQYAENTYFGKPSGLLDQLTSAVGGIIFADFADPRTPKIEKAPCRRSAAGRNVPLRHRYPGQPQRTDERVCGDSAGDGAGGRLLRKAAAGSGGRERVLDGTACPAQLLRRPCSAAGDPLF